MPLHHELTYAIIFARDMGVMMQFYAEVLGLPVRYPGDTSALGDEEWVTFGTGTCQLSLHAGGEAVATDSIDLTFACSDIHATREDLVGRGVEIDEVFDAAPCTQVAKGRDPEGNRFSICEINHDHGGDE